MHHTRRIHTAGAVLVALVLAAMAIPGSAMAPSSLLAASPANAASEARPEAAGALDINSASVEDLMTVQGIGQVIAQRIVEFREKNGPYKSVDDLLKVQGIGEKSLAKIRDRLSAGRSRK